MDQQHSNPTTLAHSMKKQNQDHETKIVFGPLLREGVYDQRSAYPTRQELIGKICTNLGTREPLVIDAISPMGNIKLSLKVSGIEANETEIGGITFRGITVASNGFDGPHDKFILVGEVSDEHCWIRIEGPRLTVPRRTVPAPPGTETAGPSVPPASVDEEKKVA